ncbi:EAL domain-containing protein [Butyrivibrio sp. WCE2006]|uniref:EAL domain-containing protein n=1 Tax=Butyrivibrio sp. WCE2006 TaxID=1410611 RepID=UPI0005D1621A|nr:EAL domain-containing protein [Butyrivibrio sp. WCE2006]
MYNWISPFNYDFAIAAIPIQVILLLFYGVRRNLPIRQSSCFWLVMFANLVMTTADIISCEMNEIWYEYPLWVMYAINHAYFLGFIVRGWALFAYTAESSHSHKDNWIFRIVTALPASVAVLLILSTPWTSAIYTIAEDGYHNCSLYKTIYFSTYFYIIISLIIVIFNWAKLSRRMKAGLLSFNLLLLLGIIIRKQFYHMLVTSYFSILCIIIIYLTSENPDLYRDNRTRLLNKDALDLIGLDYWERKVPFSLLTMAIHNYEESKSVYGISQVNDGLKAIASWLVSSYPKYSAFYTRNGNFILLIKGHLNEDPGKMMEEWKEKYEALQRSYYGIVQMKISAMLIPDSVIDTDGLVAGDLARYAVANSYNENRRGIYVFSDEMIKGVKNQKSIERAVKDAIADNRFEVYFQPIYSNKEGKVLGAEALARLNDSKMGFIPPLDFIHVAEKNGDIMEIGRQIFEKICIFLERIDPKELGIEFINVNLSPIQCMSNSLSQELASIAAKHNIPMSMFDFEITESIIDDYDMIQMQIAGLQAMGAELSMDDFGTGASNISSLMTLPIHVVKVDMTFTRSFFAGKAGFLPDLIRLFQHSNMEIVVEGIETEEMKDKMAEMGCDYEQGYFFSKPLPPADFVKYMESMVNA